LPVFSVGRRENGIQILCIAFGQKGWCEMKRLNDSKITSVDIAPPPNGDGIVDHRDLAVLADYWLEDYYE
jgi:hypothetical protein